MNDTAPRSILAIVQEAGGPEAAAALIAAVGGTEIYIPKVTGPDHWLVKLIGEAAVAAVQAELGHGRAHVARGEHEAQRRRRERIVELAAEGLSSTLIARAVGCTERTVRRVRGEASA